MFFDKFLYNTFKDINDVLCSLIFVLAGVGLVYSFVDFLCTRVHSVFLHFFFMCIHVYASSTISIIIIIKHYSVKLVF